MRTLVLEAFAVWLALAAVSGHARAAEETVVAKADGTLPPAALKGHAVFKQREAGALQRVVLAVDSGQVKEIRIIRTGAEATKFNSVGNTAPASGAAFPVPEPGTWGTTLAGLLGVIAIARRRMSL